MATAMDAPELVGELHRNKNETISLDLGWCVRVAQELATALL
jgi:hypothetical protein